MLPAELVKCKSCGVPVVYKARIKVSSQSHQMKDKRDDTAAVTENHRSIDA